MIVHQAIYGDKFGSYALIKTSLENIELAKRICNITDLLDRPSNGQLTQPVFRAFSSNGFYLFIKSFPDNDSSVRKGRVLSHTLIVEQGDLHQLNDLDLLFPFFISIPNKELDLKPLVIGCASSDSDRIESHNSREASAINCLVDYSCHKEALVWVGEEGYLPFITKLWRQLNGKIRANLKLGVGFYPQKAITQDCCVFYILKEYEAKWQSQHYCVVGKGDRGTLKTMSSFHLAGYGNKSAPLRDLIKNFEIEPAEIEDYGYLEAVAITYSKLSASTEFKSLVVFCDLISKFSPDQTVSKKEKNKILGYVLSRIESASAEQILMLKDVDWKGFSNAQQFVGVQVANWVVNFRIDSQATKSIANLVSQALAKGLQSHWWQKSFSKGLKTLLGNWKAPFAPMLWNWFSIDAALVEQLEKMLTNDTQIEMDLVASYQNKDTQLAKSIQQLSIDRTWLVLHSLSLLRLYNPKESVKRQIAIDTDSEHFAALRKMRELINDKTFIESTIEIGDSRLVKIAGKIVAKKASLLEQLDVKNRFWRQVWLQGIEQGNDVWDGINNPKDILFKLFEEIIAGNILEPNLLFRLSNTNYIDLSSFKRRPEVWQHLDGSVKSSFLKASALGCVYLLENNNAQLDTFEKEIQSMFIDSAFLKMIVENIVISASTKIQLFENLPVPQEQEFLLLINTTHFSSNESKRIGKLVSRNRCKKATKAICDLIYTRTDLKPALLECQSLLDIFQKWKLLGTGHLSNAISKEEWCDAFLKQCCNKYPKGPSDKGLWGRAGGKDYDLLATGSGREIWRDAIKKIQCGRVATDVQKLILEALKDYPFSDELKKLQKNYR